MKQIQTDTGFVVLVDVDGDVHSICNISPGTHPVSDRIDPDKSFDVDDKNELLDYAPNDK